MACQAEASFSVTFHRIHELISLTQQLVQRSAVTGKGNYRAHAACDTVAGVLQCCREPRMQPLRHFWGVFCLGQLYHHGKLVAAHPPETILQANERLPLFCKTLQEPVTRLVSEPIINVLETIKIEIGK